MSYTLVSISSRPGAYFAVDEEDYERFVTDMPNWKCPEQTINTFNVTGKTVHLVEDAHGSIVY